MGNHGLVSSTLPDYWLPQPPMLLSDRDRPLVIRF